jgi:hypothetical protein
MIRRGLNLRAGRGPRCLLGGLLLSACLCAGPINLYNFAANSTLINFDNLPGGACNLCGPAVTNQYAGAGAVFSNPSYPGSSTADSNLTPLITGASSNSLFVYQGGIIGDGPAQPFEIQLSGPITMLGFDYGSSVNAYLEMDVYGVGNTLLESVDFVGNPAPIGLAGYAGVETTTPITEVDISYHPDTDPSRTLNFSIDNLEFEGGIVPEPAALGLVATGLLGIGIVLGRQRG